MPRTKKKTTGRAKGSKRKITRKPKKLEIGEQPVKEEKMEVKKELEPRKEPVKPEKNLYFGLSYETWINVILVVAIILIAGILAGVGTLVQKTYYSAPQIAPVSQYSSGIGVKAVREKAKKVLDIIAMPGNYNITSIYPEHGVYRINLEVKTAAGVRNGTVFMSLDGKQMYFKYLDVDKFLQKFQNKTIAVMSQ